MTQLVLNISDPSVLPTLKKVVKAFKGVTIDGSHKTKGVLEGLEDVRAGRISGPYDSVEDLMEHLLK